jgi:hypothetical protein
MNKSVRGGLCKARAIRQFKSARPDHFIHFSLKQLKMPVRKSSVRPVEFKSPMGLSTNTHQQSWPGARLMVKWPDFVS